MGNLLLGGAGILIAFRLCAAAACIPQGPCYSESSIVNAASFVKGALAPNAVAAIFGTNLSWVTRPLVPEDVIGGRLPLQLAGVTVRFGPAFAPLYYVSPTQINVLIPGNLLPGPYDVQVVRDGWAGPAVKITLSETAPALFLMDSQTVVASHEDFSVITKDSPGRPGKFAILWATGLGSIVAPLGHYAQLPLQAAAISRLSEFRVLLNGAPVDPSRIAYAGIAPMLAGVYQINVKLPDAVGPDPEIQLAIGSQTSPPGIRLPARPRD